eukprot:TRINITY_DN21698_c0_g1_i1.p1 TRINITY_DN21698_c0_g1~~TRINITY_DN21698_c0_g1_i1.p1  ORF type:complete len:184 (+),score=32.33 TRINITY_DN21698_c0_g1_i1:64-615(+)
MVVVRVAGREGIVDLKDAKCGKDIILHFGPEHVAVRKGHVLKEDDQISTSDVVLVLQDNTKKRSLKDMETHLSVLEQLATKAGGTLSSLHSAPAIPDDHPHMLSMQEMMDGSVSPSACRKALYYGKLDFDAAMAWLFEHLESDSLKEPITDQELAALYPPTSVEPSDLNNQLSYFLQQAVGGQ